jgi:hypothetical protein
MFFENFLNCPIMNLLKVFFAQEKRHHVHNLLQCEPSENLCVRRGPGQVRHRGK